MLVTSTVTFWYPVTKPSEAATTRLYVFELLAVPPSGASKSGASMKVSSPDLLISNRSESSTSAPSMSVETFASVSIDHVTDFISGSSAVNVATAPVTVLKRVLDGPGVLRPSQSAGQQEQQPDGQRREKSSDT